MPDVYSADRFTTGTVAVGGSTTGTIETAYDHDWFAVELVAGRTYVIDLRGSPTDDGTLRDPYLRGIHDAGGNRISNTTNDDGGQGYNSRVTFTATESGTHYIAAGAYTSHQGTYEVEVTDTSPPMVGPDVDSGDPPDRQEQVQQQPPVFGSQFYGFELEENADGSVARLSLGAVSAADPDGGSVSYGIEGGNESGRFEIDAASGELFYVGAGEDYETGSTRFELTVRASDGDETTDTSVTVNVTDVDEPVVVDPPVTQPDQSTPQTVSEPAGEDFSRAPSTSGRVAVGDTATGRIGSSGDRDWFAVELVAGRTYVIDLRGSPTDDGTLSDPYLRGIYDADGNRISNTTNDDGGRGYNSRLTFTATESGTHYIAAGAWSSRRGTYEVEVTDTSPPETPQEQVQQQPPAFDRQAHLFELEENADGSTDRLSLGAVSATDPDGGSVSYGIEGGNESGRFEIDAASGELFYVGGGEDYETGSTRFELTVRASDGDQTTDATVTVDVTDAAEAPAFAQAGYAFDLAENADGSVARLSLGTVSATDPDGGSVSYGIEGGNESGRFEIGAASGELFYVGGGEDYETGSTSFELTVRASDGDRTTDTAVTVNVTDVDEPVAVDPPVAQEVQSVPQTVSEGATDLPNDNSTPGRVAVGGSATGTIGTAYDHDRFAVELVAGRTYQFDLEGSPGGGGTLPDTYFRAIRDSEGRYQSGTYNDDFEGSRDSRVTFTPEDSGTYYAQVSGDRNETGTYTLSVTDMTPPETGGSTTNPVTPDPQEPTVEFVGPDQDAQQQPETSQVQTEPMSVSEGDTDLRANPDTTGRVVVGGSATGAIGFYRDQDWFAVELEAGKTYRIDLKGSATDDGTLADPSLRGIRDADGETVYNLRGDDRGVGWNSRVYFTADEDGTYFVAAGADRDADVGIGTYTLSVTEFTDDYAADPATTGTVAVGGSTTGNIGPPGDEDWFAVVLEAGKTYRFDLEGSRTSDVKLSDPYLRGIYNADGERIANTTDNNSGWASNSRVYFTPNEDATYYVAAGAYGTYHGTYILSVAEIPDDYADGPATTGTVVVGGSVTSEIGPRGDKDWFAVELETGKTYRFDLEGGYSGKGTLVDPYLRGIYDAGGERIANTTDDDSGVGRNSRVYFTPNEDATYYVAAGADGNGVGTYTLSVTEFTDDYAAEPDPATTGTVAVGSSVEGSIEPPRDEDWFAVVLEAGKTYRFDLEGSHTSDVKLSDPYLRGIHDAGGERIANTTDDDGGEGRNSRVYFTPNEDATYYVAAGAYRDFAGTYTLSVTEVADDYAADSATTGMVAVGGSVAGYIEPPGDEDWFAVELVAGKIYRFDLERVRADYPVLDQPHIPESLFSVLDYLINGSTWDPYLRGIHDADGSLIDGTTNDDGGQGRDSRVYFTPQGTNTYYVAAGADGNDVGAYTLSVTDVTDDHGAAPDTAGMVAVDGAVEGRIEPPGDQDWFAVELEAGTRYRFDLKGSWTGDGTLADPYLRGIHDADGNEIPGTQDDDGGRHENSRVTFTPVANGTYYVAAGADGDGVGTYTLSVEEVDGM